MPRRNRNVELKPISQEDKRITQGNVMRIVRMVNYDDSSLIAGALKELELDNTLPEFKDLRLVHPVYVLDPRIVKKEINSGIHLGYDLSRRRLLARGSEFANDHLEVSVGGIAIKGFHNGVKDRLFLSLQSEELRAERRAYYEALTDWGVRGLPIYEDQTVPMPEIYLGQLAIQRPEKDKRDLDVEAQERKEYIKVVNTGFAIHGINTLRLGETMTRVPEA